jgi:DNA-binding CsgD family transcriptional regulator
MDGTRPSSFLSDHEWQAIQAHLRLSSRELEVARCVMDGASDVSIAGMLLMSRHTARTHLRRIFHKLGVRSQAQLIARLFQAHVIIKDPSRLEQSGTA